MYEDSVQAIERDDKYVKAFVCNGESLIMLGQENGDIKQCDKGLERLKKALKLCYQQKLSKSIMEEIQQQILRGQKIRFFVYDRCEQKEKQNLLSKLD